MRTAAVRERILSEYHADPDALYTVIAARAGTYEGYVATVLNAAGIRRKPPQEIRRETRLQRRLRLRAEDREHHRRYYAEDPRYREMSKLASRRRYYLQRGEAPRVAEIESRMDELRIRPRRQAQRAAKGGEQLSTVH